MPAVAAAVLEPIGRARVALQGVAVEARLQGLLSEVTVTQTYRNLEDTNIEATYSFPLPLDAVLLELTLDLNGRQLQGVVQARAEAEARYEGAIDDGDTALLLQQVEPGTFSMNLGNLLAGETAVIRFRYAQLHRWQGDRLRFHLPTTIAPRYGDPLAAGFAPHHVPEHALSADYGFTLKLEIAGQLAQVDLQCPSHPVAVNHAGAIRLLTLAGGSRLMDRDFVLVLRVPQRWHGEGTVAADGDGYVALASFHLPVPDRREHKPRCLKLVVDCSGSMAGDSIAQARAALGEILAHLRAGDHFNLVTFGSTYRLLFPAAVPATDTNIRVAADFLRGLDANMGGTETGAALEAAYACRAPAGLPTDLLLITDGEITNHRAVVERARTSGHRIFTVGVGCAVAETFVRTLAEATGGACELVSPREGMAERIVRHFARIDQPRVESVRVDWPQAPTRQVPGTFDALFAGDTLHVFGWFAAAPIGAATLHLQFADDDALTQCAALAGVAVEGSQDVLRRVAAQARLAELPLAEAVALAVEYQLVTEQTSCVLVHVRDADAKADGVPALRKVPQVLAAGWSGAGSVPRTRSMNSPRAAPSVGPLRSQAAPPRSMSSLPSSCAAYEDIDFDFGDSRDYADLPAVPCRQADSPATPPRDYSVAIPTSAFDHVVAGINARFPDHRAAQMDLHRLQDLASLGLEASLIDALRALVDAANSEQQVVVAVLTVVAASPAGKGLSRNARRVVRRAMHYRAPTAKLIDAVSVCMTGTRRDWRHRMPLTDEEKQRVVALAREWIAPESGMEKHFVRVVQGNGIACTELEKEWLLFWHDYQRTTTPAPKSEGMPPTTNLNEKPEPQRKPSLGPKRKAKSTKPISSVTSNRTSTKCCADCGSVIPPARLTANPSAMRCVVCQEKLEQKNPRDFTRRIDEGIGGTREDNKKMRARDWGDMRNRGR